MGSAVEKWAKGDRVLIPAVLSCGFCDNCRLGRENVCQRQEMVGNNIDGAYAEYIRVPAKDVFRIPDSLPLEETSIVADAISTPYHAVKNRGEVRPGDLVAVFGCGGVGINVVQIAAAAGGIVYAVDIDDKKLKLAEKLGATVTFNSTDENPVKQIRALTQKRGVDVSFEAIGIPRGGSGRQNSPLFDVGNSRGSLWGFCEAVYAGESSICRNSADCLLCLGYCSHDYILRSSNQSEQKARLAPSGQSPVQPIA